MNIDDSFKKPGAVPFKWEIRPGVPKVRNQPKRPTPVIQPPPAARLHFTSQTSFSRRLPGQPDIVSSGGCFPSPLVKQKRVKKRNGSPRVDYEPEYSSDLGTTPSRWSFSSRRSLSPLSSSFGSSGSDSRSGSDAEWATYFGLF